MFVIVDSGNRVRECGDGCFIDDRVEVEQPAEFKMEFKENWVLQDGSLIHQPIVDETDYAKENKTLHAQINSLIESKEFLENCLIEIGGIVYA